MEQALFEKHGDQIFVREGETLQGPVRFKQARPVGMVSGAISVRNKKKKEIRFVDDICKLHPKDQELITQELSRSYFMPEILKINKTEIIMGYRYWEVETNKGQCSFFTKDSRHHVTWINDDHIVLKDTRGNRYRISSLNELDKKSFRRFEFVA